MIADELTYRIHEAFEFEPTAEQEHAISVFSDFMTDRRDRVVMVLRGAAGTGKTSLAGAMVRALASLGIRMVLMAPTGRAAKVFSINAGYAAATIHRSIYRQRIAGDLSVFNLNDNLYSNTVFIVDEASMVANGGMNEAVFGSGHLLDDLIQYVYGGNNCRMMLIGDKAQLPPVGEEDSPALMASVLESYGLEVHEADLNEVLRQAAESGILWNATMIRSMITHDEITRLPKIRLRGFADIRVVPGNELIEALSTSYSRVGQDETMVVTRSNRRANIYNQGIRNMVLGHEDELCSGDMLMIVKNKYLKSKSSAAAKTNEKTVSDEAQDGIADISFLANGDRMRVYRVRNVHQMHGFRFAEVTMRFPDYDDYELTDIVMLDTLTTEAPALTREQSEKLYNSVMEDYADIPKKEDRLRSLKEDKYYNAIQIKYAYAVTCHKAQGGQWAHIYVDQGYMTDDMLTPDYIHWLYTAFTRATECLFLVNLPANMQDA
ncbi:MAG: ATP-dependent RecD-like DNA helicase [Prevotella sp.]